MSEGDPGFDVWAMDVARYGPFANRAYTNAKVRENYSRRFSITFPNEELPAARPLRTTGIYDRLCQRNAVWGASFGLEHALWFAPPGTPPVEAATFRRSNAHPHVAAECRAVREAVGLLEISNFAKYEVRGPGAEAWLARIMAGRIPPVGRLSLTPMLNALGKLIGDFTLARLAADRFLVFGSGVAETYHLRWFEQHLPPSGVVLRSLAGVLDGLAIAGPRSRDLLQRLVDEDLSTAAFPFLAVAPMEVGLVSTIVGRISYTGDLGYEIWCPADQLRLLHDTLVEAGADLSLRHFGARALNSLRLEKGFGSWAREFRPIYGPCEAGLEPFVAWKRGGFIGHAAAVAERERGPERRRVTLVVDAADADVMGDEPIWQGGEVVGWVTSGGYAHHVRLSVALGYVPARLAAADAFEVEILGERRPARIAREPLFDPTGGRMRA
jgi:dimethylglycine dehydrogenase